ncbi:MAG: putative Ig domain-containing protein [Verrucomicrobiales bacterium]
MKKSAVSFAMILLGTTVSDRLAARPFRVNMFPNGNVFGCANCHVSPGGGGQRTPFGEAVFAIVGGSSMTPFWSPSLAAADSDGDGGSNGQEMGDVDGDGIPAAGVTATNPGNRPPVFISAAVTDATIGFPYRYDATASDAENNTIVFSKISGPSWITVSSAGAVAGSPPETGAGQFAVTLKVQDQGSSTRGYSGDFATQEFILHVIASYAGWQNLSFNLPAEAALAEAKADPDHDGLDNLTEYVLRTVPKVASSVQGIARGFDSEGHLQWLIEVRDDDPKLTLRGEAANDVGYADFISLDAVVTDPVVGDGFKTYGFTDDESSVTALRRFARVRFAIEP